MSRTNSIQSYPHCRQIWDEAYAAASGSILVEHSNADKPMTMNEQNSLISDLVHYRVLVRKENSKYYPEGHPEHMTSIFDPFVVTKVTVDGKLYVRLRRRKPEQFKIIPEDLE